MKRSFATRALFGALSIVIVSGASGCATRTSMMAASTYGQASVYRSAAAYVQLAPDKAFNPAVNMLLERSDIDITELKETDNRCEAVIGDHTLTFRVIESANGRSRLSMLVGGGDNPEVNQELADKLIGEICHRLAGACESEAHEF